MNDLHYFIMLNLNCTADKKLKEGSGLFLLFNGRVYVIHYISLRIVNQVGLHVLMAILPT